jgi:hypothetical protein
MTPFENSGVQRHNPELRDIRLLEDSQTHKRRVSLFKKPESAFLLYNRDGRLRALSTPTTEKISEGVE